MSAPRILLAFLLLGCAQEQPAPPPAPSPVEEQARIMDRIEALVRMPRGAWPLADYARYYAWQSREDGVRKVVATYHIEANPRRHWVAETALPAIMDGGCGVIELSYDVAEDRIEGAACHGEA
ncbi:MAG TPA: hypothetical protein VEX35_05495 [Allosphingosinicella sp.]|nr:hypothetical protein [Allosphingosinicella sp.]